jgi:hypothetical protein
MTRGTQDEYIYIAFHRMAGESGRRYVIPFHGMEFRTTTLQRRFLQPLGKLKTEHWVPVDSFVCQIVERLRSMRTQMDAADDDADLTSMVNALDASRHVAEMFRRAVPDPRMQRLLTRIGNRLTKMLAQLNELAPDQK